MSIRLCNSGCPRTCNGYSYFTPSEIERGNDRSWCPHQVLFMVNVRESILPSPDPLGLHGYGWPAEPSGYIKQPGKPQPRAQAAFEGVAMVAVVFEARISHIMVSELGRLHLAMLDKEILQGRGFEQLSDDSRSVIMYLIKARVDGYAHWKRQGKMRRQTVGVAK
jgi:hypothetical protein